MFCWRDLTLPILIRYPSQARFKLLTPGHMRQSNTQGLPRGMLKLRIDRRMTLQRIAFIYQQNNKLNNSHLTDFFTSLHSFPSPCFQSFYYVTVSISVPLFCKSNKDVDYRHDKPNKPKTNK